MQVLIWIIELPSAYINAVDSTRFRVRFSRQRPASYLAVAKVFSIARHKI